MSVLSRLYFSAPPSKEAVHSQTGRRAYDLPSIRFGIHAFLMLSVLSVCEKGGNNTQASEDFATPELYEILRQDAPRGSKWRLQLVADCSSMKTTGAPGKPSLSGSALLREGRSGRLVWRAELPF